MNIFSKFAQSKLVTEFAQSEFVTKFAQRELVTEFAQSEFVTKFAQLISPRARNGEECETTCTCVHE